MHFFGHPHPARAFAGRLPRHFYRHPHPARAFMRDTRIPRRQPPPRPRLLRQATHTPLPASPAPPTPSARDTHTLLPATPPTRACGAPPPPPLGGGVRAWRYQVSSRIRLFSGISPCCGPCGYRHGGRGRRGGGTCSPSPVFHAPTILLLCRQPSSRPR